MRPEDLFRAIGAADDELLERSRKRRAISKRWFEFGALAACVCIVAAVSVITVKMGARDYVDPDTVETTEQAEQTGETALTLHGAESPTVDIPAIEYSDETRVPDGPVETETPPDPDSIPEPEYSDETSPDGPVETETPLETVSIPEPEYSNETSPDGPAETETPPEPVSEEPPAGKTPPPEQAPSPAYYDDSFSGFYFDNPVSGMPVTYDEVMDILLDRPGELDSFYLIETVRLLSPSECAEVEGIYDFYGSRHSETTEAGSDITPAAYMEDDTIYEVVLKKDLITGEEPNERCFMLVRHMGNMDEQKKGDPLFAPGELFCAPVDNKGDGEDFRKTVGDYLLRFDVKISQSGEYTAYFRGYRSEADELPFGENVDYTVITSTTKNPARYTKAVRLSELVKFLQKDWNERRNG